MHLSIIIPTYNEASSIVRTLKTLPKKRVEILVVDGGSTDKTKQLSAPYAKVLDTPKGRARQMNAGARAATGDVLLFLHADTTLQDGWVDELQKTLLDKRVIGGACHIHFDNETPPYRLINVYSNLRAKLTGMYHGDQAIFIRKKVFHQIGGYPDIPLMEDVVLSRKMRHAGKTRLLKTTATTSARRIERLGIIKSTLRYFYFKIAFFFGARPEYLARIYQKSD